MKFYLGRGKEKRRRKIKMKKQNNIFYVKVVIESKADIQKFVRLVRNYQSLIKKIYQEK